MTANSEIKELTGLPVNDFYKRSGPSQLTDRYNGADVGPLLRQLADDPNVVEYGWRQYTPYFNDGDVCEFGVHELWVRTTLDDEDKDTYELEVSSWHPTLGTERYIQGDVIPSKYGYGHSYGPGRWEHKENPFPETTKLAERVAEVIGGAEVTLLEWFGDHAEITITKDGIQVDEYDHG